MRIRDWSSDVCSSDLIAEGLIGWRRKPQFLRKQFVRLGYLEGVHARRGKIEIVATVILPVHISRLRTQREIAELISGYERRAMTFLIVVGWASRIAVVGDQRAHLEIRLADRRGEVADAHASGN